MLTFAAGTRVFVATEPIDFRYGLDRIAQLCRSKMGENPMSGAVFVFRNKRRIAIKILFYDGQGFWLCQKRLSSGRFSWWPSSNEAYRPLASRELQILLWNGNPTQAAMAEDWRAIA